MLPPSPGLSSMRIRMKILLLLASALLVAVLIGGSGLWTLRQTNSQMDAMYHNSLEPVVAVTAIRALFSDNRTGLNRALLDGSVEAATREKARNLAMMAQMDQLWGRYYPAMVSSPEEKTAAERFIAARTRTRALKVKLEGLMTGGQHAEAVAYMLGTVGPAFNDEAAAIETIVQENVREASADFASADHLRVRALWTVAGILSLGTLGLLVAGWALSRSIMAPLMKAKDLAALISEGQIGHGIEARGRDEVGDLLRSLAVMDKTLCEITGKVRTHAGEVARSVKGMAEGNDGLSLRTQEQASALEETAAAMEEMTASVRENAHGAESAHRVASGLRGEAAHARTLAVESMEAMARIQTASTHIQEMVGLIDTIAFQTNILALNAAVEAARAGEHGRGFAVVAGEVRRLAQHSATTAKDIKAVMETSLERIGEGVRLVTDTGEALEKMEQGAIRALGIAGEISSASEQQAAGIEQVNQAVTELDGMTQQNAALVEQASAASHHALGLARALVAEVAFFRDADTGAPRSGVS